MTNPTPDAPGLQLPKAAGFVARPAFGPDGFSKSQVVSTEDAYTADQMHDMYQRGLAARPLPSDWVAVPREPTEAMVDAGEAAWPKIKNACCPWPEPEEVYAAMLKAAPSAPAEVVQTAPEPLAQGDACNVEGTWLWGKLMDWCRAQGTAPANFDSLFAIAREAHKLYASPQRAAEVAPKYTTGHCANHNQPGGCQLHNMQCGWPSCDRRPIENPPQPSASVGERARDERFTAMLIGIISDVQDALGFTDEDKECSNGSLEIVAAIRELQEQAVIQQRGEAVEWQRREHGSDKWGSIPKWSYDKAMSAKKKYPSNAHYDLRELFTTPLTTASGGGE